MLKCQACRILLCRIEYGGVVVHVCPDCHSTLVDADRLRLILAREPHGNPAQGEPLSAEQVPERYNLNPVRCPKCLKHMEKMRAASATTEFHVDVCRSCRLFWFDRGELEQAKPAEAALLDKGSAVEDDLAARRALAQVDLKFDRDEIIRAAQMTSGVVRTLTDSLWGLPWL